MLRTVICLSALLLLTACGGSDSATTAAGTDTASGQVRLDSAFVQTTQNGGCEGVGPYKFLGQSGEQSQVILEDTDGEKVGTVSISGGEPVYEGDCGWEFRFDGVTGGDAYVAEIDGHKSQVVPADQLRGADFAINITE